MAITGIYIVRVWASFDGVYTIMTEEVEKITVIILP